MNLPTLPTDNLYKFMAISGLVLIVVSVVGPYRMRQEARARQFDIETDLATLTPEIDGEVKLVHDLESQTIEIQSRTEDLGRAIELWMKRQRPSEAVGTQLLDHLFRLRESSAALQAQSFQTLDRLTAMKVRIAQRKVKESMLAHIQRDATMFARLSYASIVAGAGLTLAGFVLWYARVQRPLDRQAKRGSPGV